uniref:Ig-like domain-containing protein n=1 Tax=Cyprinus carpio TaxID=7962 RepID=A0A8C2C217_CYPCA
MQFVELMLCSLDIYITGYSGQSVVLKSGADSSWKLTRVQWSIYKNTTFIASLKDGEVIIYKFWRYQGRLKLDTSTGDLTISNVTIDDSMIYNVALLASDYTRKQVKVHLTVQEPLQKPVIKKTLLSLNDSQCYVALECTASGQKVNLSWTPDGEFNGSYISGMPNSVNSSLVLFASINGKIKVTFNCTASSVQQTETRQMTVRCSGGSSLFLGCCTLHINFQIQTQTFPIRCQIDVYKMSLRCL